MGLFSSFYALFTTKTNTVDLDSLSYLNSPISSLLIDETSVVCSVNNSFTMLTGYEKKDIVGEKISILKSGKHDNSFYKTLWQNILKVDRYSFEIYNRCKNGEVILMREKVVQIEQNQKKYFIVTQEDITQEKRLLSRQHYLATHDTLTGLANRILLKDRYEHAVSNAKRNYKKLAIFLCDLNEFKEINDTYGHNVGDTVLRKVASNLVKSVRDSDTVARYGGDEFVVISEHIQSYDEVEEIYQTIETDSSLDVEFADGSCHVSMSVGYSVFPDDGLNFEQLISMADTRMYNNKQKYYGH